MRILCLHGYGTSGAILRSQLDAFIRKADACYEFVFLDGEHECPKAQGMGLFVKGPFRCFNRAFGPCDIQRSLDHLQDFIDAEGPFDGLLGFSQGGSLALAYLLQEAEAMADDPGRAPAFSFAVFLSTIAAFSPDPAFAAGLLAGLTPADRRVLKDFPHDAAGNDYAALSGPPERALFFSALGRVLDTSLRGAFIARDTPLGLEGLGSPGAGTAEALPRIVHPALVAPSRRVRIPTVHVVGAGDDALLVGMARRMEELCASPRLTRSLTHGGGHDVPRSPKDVQMLWWAVEWAVNEAQHQVW